MHDLGLTRLHLVKIELKVANSNTVIGEFDGGTMIKLRRLQQRF